MMICGMMSVSGDFHVFGLGQTCIDIKDFYLKTRLADPQCMKISADIIPSHRSSLTITTFITTVLTLCIYGLRFDDTVVLYYQSRFFWTPAIHVKTRPMFSTTYTHEADVTPSPVVFI